MRLSEGTQNRIFSHVFANYDSVALFSGLQPLFFKPALVPSSGKTEVTFFGSGFVHTGSQCVRLRQREKTTMLSVDYDEKTNTFYCTMPSFQKSSKKEDFPVECAVEVSLDSKQFWEYEKKLVIYWSKTQIESIEPQCGAIVGSTTLRIYMPIDPITLQHLSVISVGFRINGEGTTHFQDWICAEGCYEDGFITCKTPSIPHFDPQSPFYLVDVSLNAQQFTQAPQTFRFYSITELTLSPNEGLQSQEQEVHVRGKGLFDVPGKQLQLALQYEEGGQVRRCERVSEIKWVKDTRSFVFRMPSLVWLMGESSGHLAGPMGELIRAAPVSAILYLTPKQTIHLGHYRFTLPPPEPEEEKKDAKKDAKKVGKK